MVETRSFPFAVRGAESLAVRAGGLVVTGGLAAAPGGDPLAPAQAMLEALGSDLPAAARLKAYLADIRSAQALRARLPAFPAATSAVGAMLPDGVDALVELIAGADEPPVRHSSPGGPGVTQLGGLLFCDGAHFDPSSGAEEAGDLRAQARQVLGGILGALAPLGAGAGDLVKVNNTAARWHNYGFYNEVYNELLAGANAARCSVGGVLEQPLALVEVDAVAASGGGLRFVDSTMSGVGRTSFSYRDDTVYLPELGPCKGPHAHGARAGDVVFIAGECPYDAQDRLVGPGDIAAQTRQTLRNVELSLEALGAGLSDVVRTNVTLSDMRLFEGFDAAYAAAFAGPYPARTVVGAPLGQYGILVEIEAIAVIGAGLEGVFLTGEPA
ncbi:Rid family hydrolase [Ancylobacter sp. MQZ15Z-1]|uniref:Rid family hydrolase n=1 Tax=Ancylobacter mangrovi TaxID=2972472 RepID=A0A9X2PEL2_9HYPH|nr:RidA family protein [Ancylobacter mangrovi]MCS0497291.1 Rid family hydrolase [Ancylobacter mangrovi]